MESRDIPSTQREVMGPLRRPVDHWPSVSSLCDQHNIERMMRIHHKRMSGLSSKANQTARVDATEPITRTYSFIRDSLSKKHLRLLDQARVQRENQSIVQRLVDILTSERAKRTEISDHPYVQPPRYEKVLRERKERRENIRRLESESIMEENLLLEKRILGAKTSYDRKQMIKDADAKLALAANVKHRGREHRKKQREKARRQREQERLGAPPGTPGGFSTVSSCSSASATGELLLQPISLTHRRRNRRGSNYSPFALGGSGSSMSTGSLLSEPSSIAVLGPLDRRRNVKAQAEHLRSKLQTSTGAAVLSVDALEREAYGLDGDPLPATELVPSTEEQEAEEEWQQLFVASSSGHSPSSRGGVRISGRLFLLALSLDEAEENLVVSGDDVVSQQHLSACLPLEAVAEHLLRSRGLQDQVDVGAARTALVAELTGVAAQALAPPIKTLAPLLEATETGFALSSLK